MLLTEEQQLVRDTMRAFAQEQLAPNAARWDREAHFPRAELQALGELGAMGMVVPEAWGGAAMDYEREPLSAGVFQHQRRLHGDGGRDAGLCARHAV